MRINVARNTSLVKKGEVKNVGTAREGITTDFATSPVTAYLIYKSFKKGYSTELIGRNVFNSPVFVDIRGKSLTDVLATLKTTIVPNGDSLLDITSIVCISPKLPPSFTVGGQDDVEVRVIFKSGKGLSVTDIEDTLNYVWKDLYNMLRTYLPDSGHVDPNYIVTPKDIEDIISWINKVEPNILRAGIHSKKDPLPTLNLQTKEQDLAFTSENITEADLKKTVDDLYAHIKSLNKPNSYYTKGEYYGSTQLYKSRDNMLEIVTSYTSPSTYYSSATHYNNCYAVKVGGAYDYNDYKEKLEPLYKLFDRAEVQGYSISKPLVIGDKTIRLMDIKGTNFCVYGFNRKN